MNNQKMFVFDLDGTLLNSKFKVQKETIKEIKRLRKQGHIFAANTGRPLVDALRDTKTKWFDYYILNNGTYFYKTKTKETFLDQVIDNEIGKKIFDLYLKNSKEAMFAVHTLEGIYRLILEDDLNLNHPMINETNRFKFYSKEVVEDALANGVITQLSVRSHPEVMDKWYKDAKKIINDKAEAVITSLVYLDINPPKTDKLEGIKKILPMHNLTLKDVVTFGDSDNDIQMLAHAGLSFAMAHAKDHVKKAAKEVIGSNNSDAIAKTLSRF